jgi:hypothetical protein
MPEPPSTPRRRWLRFSLRSLLLIVVLIAIPLGWKMNRVHNQRVVVAEIEKIKGQVAYDSVVELVGHRQLLKGPEWLRRLLGDDFFSDVEFVQIGGPQVTERTISQVATLPYLKWLHVRSNGISDDGLKYLAGKNTLEELHLNSSSVTDKGVAQLAELQGLNRLEIGIEHLSDSGLKRITTVLRQLDSLELVGTRGITDNGLEQLANLDNLHHLGLKDMLITDAGLVHLHGMENLKRLSLFQTKATNDGVTQLHKLLPNCKISWY